MAEYPNWKEEIGYQEPSKYKCKHCRFFREKEDRYLDRSWIKSCLFAEKKFTGKEDTFGVYFGVSPEGTCNNFKKILSRCPHYYHDTCKKRNCNDNRFDDNCMEVE